jgi:hypothetical protein
VDCRDKELDEEAARSPPGAGKAGVEVLNDTFSDLAAASNAARTGDFSLPGAQHRKVRG